MKKQANKILRRNGEKAVALFPVNASERGTELQMFISCK